MTELRRDRIEILMLALRAPLPERFHWSFYQIAEVNECGTTGCAMGLAGVLWPNYFNLALKKREMNKRILEFFGMPQAAVDAIFWGGAYDNYPSLSEGAPTPGDVANELEKFLADPEHYL